MDCLFRLLHLGRARAQPQRPAAYSPFGILPAELIFQVAAYLPPSSATLLSLCNHKLHETLGRKSLQELAQSDPRHNERALVLQALDRDLPYALYCPSCHKVRILSQRHEGSLEAEELYRRVSESRCLSGNNTYNDKCVTTYHAGFKFEHFQMAMRLYRRGNLAYAKAFLTCSAFLQPVRGHLTDFPSHQGLYFFEPRLVNGKIYVRAQSWIFFPDRQRVGMPWKHVTTVCAHLNGNSPFPNPYIAVFRCQLKHLRAKQASCEECRSLMRCERCPTEVCVEAKRPDGVSKGVFLVITKWQFLGSGLSPSARHWKSHLGPYRQWRYRGPGPGGIRASYEDQPGIKYDSLLKQTDAWKMLNGIS